jgi:hypothetical protein
VTEAGPRPVDGPAELIDARPLLGDPVIDHCLGIVAPPALQEFQPQLLEIPCQPRRQQAFPLVARREAVGGDLRPIEPERLAQLRVGASEDEHVRAELLAERRRCRSRRPARRGARSAQRSGLVRPFR